MSISSVDIFNVNFARSDGQEMFCHSVQNIHKLAQTSSNKAAFVYVLKERKKVMF